MGNSEINFYSQYKTALREMLKGKETEQTIILLRTFRLTENYYGDKNAYILFGRKCIDVESVWCNNNSAYIHVNCIDFEADIEIAKLSNRNIRRVMKLVYNRYLNNLKERK